MTKQVQLRRGTTAEHATFTGAVGELTIDTSKDIAVVHDGVTTGGHELVGVAATGQTIVNKDGLAIGSSIASSPLTVIGNSYISGIGTFGDDVNVGSDLTVSGDATFAGITTTLGVTIGVGNTDLIVNGTARITNTLSIGTSTITLNGNTNTISAETASFTRLSVSGENVTVATFGKTVTNTVSSGSTSIPVNNTTSLLVGDLVNVTGILTHVPIVGLGTTSVTSFYETGSTTSISTTVSAGSTVIGVSTDVGISTSNFISVAGIITNVPIVGFTTTSLGNVYNLVSITGVASTVSSASTSFPVNATTNVIVGDYVSVANSTTGAILVNRQQILGLGSTDGTPYYLTINTTSISTTVSIGSTIISIGSTSGITTSSFITVSGIITNAQVVGVITTGLTTSYQTSGSTTVASTVATGSTVISVASTSGIVVGSAIDITGIFDKVRVTGIGLTTITIGAGNTYNSTISSGLALTSFLVSETLNYAALIGSGSTSNQVLPSGTSVNVNSFITPSIPVVIIGSSVGTNLGIGFTVTYERLTTPTGPAILIGSGNTSNQSIPVGTAVSYTFLNNVRSTIIIGTGNTSTSVISAGSSLNIIRQESVQSDLNINNLKAVGITTIEQLVLSGLTFPTIDGAKGQVLATDGAGNIGFTTGGGGGGSNVILRVSSKTGSDSNDGKILPLATIRKATQLASMVGEPVTILVETGEYVEDNPIIVYDEVSIIGDSLRNIVVRPQNAGKDLFKVRNGCYLTGMTFNDYINPTTKVPQHTYNYSIAFDDPYDSSISRTGYAATAIVDITNAVYTPSTGILTVTTATPHQLYSPNSVRLSGLAFTCGYDEVGVSTFRYTNTTGVSTCTTVNVHGLSTGSKVFLAGLAFTCSAEHAGVTTTIFPDGTSQYGRIFTVTSVGSTNTFTFNAGISTIGHNYVSGGTVQKALIYPEANSDGRIDFGVISVGSSTTFTIRAGVTTVPHYYTQDGTARISKPIINKSPYIQNCSILSFLGGNGILVDGNKIASQNEAIVPELGERPTAGEGPEFGKSMVAATFTMVSFGGIGWRTINDGYAQVVSCFQIICRF